MQHFSLPYDGGLIEKGLPQGILHSYEKIWTYIYPESRDASRDVADQVVKAGLGISTAVGIGGDPIIGTNHIDGLKLLNEDPGTESIILIGEIGGNEEELAAEYLKTHAAKPVIALIAGKNAPKGRSMGHAGAIVSADGTGSAANKEAALRDAGVIIAENTQHIVDICLKLKEEGKL